MIAKTVTGIRLYCAESFFQTLAGTSANNGVMSRNVRDVPHHGINIVSRKDQAAGTFATWNAGSRKLFADGASPNPAFAKYSRPGCDPEPNNSWVRLTMHLLRTFGRSS